MTTQTWQHCTNGHDPAFWQNDESVCLIAPPDDLDVERRTNARDRGGEHRALVGGIGEQGPQEWVHSKQSRHDENAAIAILNIGRMNDGVEQEAYCVDQNVPLLALDFLAPIVARRIDAGPPFSALFTLWLSMMAAVGLTSRSACSRHRS
jgi:hypothetical protein